MTQQNLAGKTIVLIEDNLFLSDVIARKLAGVGANILRYTNGLEGLAAIRSERPDMVLLDIMMPIMNGYEVLEVMHSEGLIEQIPVIVISNSGQPVEVERVKELGVKDYLIKADFEPDEVLQKVYSNLGLEVSNNQTVDTNSSQIATNEKVKGGENVVNGGHKILIVEDDPLLRNLLSVKLSKNNCPYMFSNDGTQAIDLINNFKPDVIVLDLMLPGKNGLEILEEIKSDENLKTIPAIIFSNKDTTDARNKATELGADGFYVKASTDLTELIDELLRLAKNGKKASYN